MGTIKKKKKRRTFNGNLSRSGLSFSGGSNSLLDDSGRDRSLFSSRNDSGRSLLSGSSGGSSGLLNDGLCLLGSLLTFTVGSRSSLSFLTVGLFGFSLV